VTQEKGAGEEAAGRWAISPVLGVRDVLRAVDYYADVLGFERPEHVYGSESEKVYAIMRRGGVAIHLQIRRTPEPRQRGTHDGDGYVFVPDARALRDEFAAKGVNITRDLEAEPYGLLDFSIETPFGHRLTFGSELDPKDVPPPRDE
jgi:uncharacterized glyoxalase superfamily protein PhnB